MKSFKAPIFAAMIFVTSAAHADVSYKWVKMTTEQEKTFVEQCLHQKHDGLNAITANVALGTVSASGVGLALFYGAHGGDGPAISSALLASTMVTGAGMEAYKYLKSYMSLNEIKTLVIEQQSGRPGIVTNELEQIAAENQLDANRMLAVANAQALRGKICTEDINDLPGGVETLGNEELSERAAAAQAKEHAEYMARQEQRRMDRQAEDEAQKLAEKAQATAEKVSLDTQLNQVLSQVKK